MTTIGYAVCFLTIFLLKAYGADEKTLTEADADEYLQKFGYLDALAGGGRGRSLAKTRAVSTFQKFAHLPVTGQLDEPTKKAMLAPRCGMADVPRKKTRSGFSSKWEKPHLTWSLVRPTNQLNVGQVRTAIHQAFAVWATVIPLNFTEVSGSGADIQFEFHNYDHSDGSPFDGRGGVLAHAFFPSDGRLHFDNDEYWAFEDGAKINQGYTDLLSVTIHELGHSLGLPHSQYEEAIMYPFYRAPTIENGKLKQFELSRYDIYDIQNIYGRREAGAVTARPATRPPGPPGPPSNCPQFYAAVTGVDGGAYFFTNQDSGWMKADINGPANSATKFSVSQKFPKAPSGITAGVTERDGLTYLFQGRKVFGYSWAASTKSFTLEEGYPKDLPSDFPFVPEGAFQMKDSGHLALFKGDDFVLWDSAWNKATFKGSMKNYFPNFPANAKVSFSDSQNGLYIVNGADVSVYDFRSVTLTMPLGEVIYC